MDNWLVKIFAYTAALSIVFGGVILFCALVSLPFWLMWNWLIPTIFGLPEISIVSFCPLLCPLLCPKVCPFDKYRLFSDPCPAKPVSGRGLIFFVFYKTNTHKRVHAQKVARTKGCTLEALACKFCACKFC